MKLTKPQMKLYLIDIGLWILLLMKLTKIAMGIRAMTMKKNNLSKISITLCSILSFYWFVFFIENTTQYTLSSGLEAILTLIAIAGVGIYIIMNLIKEDIVTVKLMLIYSFILIFIGFGDGIMDMCFIGNSDFNTTVLLSSIVCETFYVIVGVCLAWNLSINK